jgi:hypothetical protein
MLKNKFFLIAVALILWQPLQPFRHMTADALSLVAAWIRD